MAGQLAPVSFLEKSLTKKYNWSLDFGMIEISCFRDTSRSEFKEPFLFRKKKSSFILELKFQNLKPLVSNSPKEKKFANPKGLPIVGGVSKPLGRGYFPFLGRENPTPGTIRHLILFFKENYLFASDLIINSWCVHVHNFC